jgi:DNA topoisomerase-1
MTSLVIVESPAKCGKIAGFLGDGYKVIASMGHIRGLDEKLEAVGIERDFEPTFVFDKDKAKAIAAIRSAAAGVKEVILAADDDREGEAIAYSVALLLGLNPTTTKRAVFHEITKSAVTKAIQNPRLLDMNRVNAQQARAMLDMMVGFTISPLLWKHVARGLSAGRCQTPALRFVVDREQEVASHTTDTSWTIKGVWASGNKEIQADMVDHLESEEDACNYMETAAANPKATIKEVSTRPWTENPPPPLITSTLQQAASSLFHSNPKNTMRIAQRLYEAGYITYMRTDKAVLGEEAQTEARALVTEKYGADYVATAQTTIKGTKKTSKKAAEPQAQEAHEAIRPTHFEDEVLAGGEWTPLDSKIYRLIRSRALQCVMASAKGETASVKFTLDAEEDFPWSASARRTTFQGWRIIGAVPVDDDASTEDDSSADSFTMLQSLKVGAALNMKQLDSQPYMTKPAPRYTEATLVKALEQQGIGRPSTFASLLDAIIEKKYVEKQSIEGQKLTLNKYTIKVAAKAPTKSQFQRAVGGEKDRLVPTELGKQALTFVVANFGDLFDYGFTASMEQRLDSIAEGKEQWKGVLKETWSSYKDRYNELNTAAGTTKSSTAKDFGGGLKAQVTKKGPLIIQEADTEGGKATFHGWPSGVAFADITEAIARDHIANSAQGEIIGVYEDEPLHKRKGQYGEYVKWRDISVPWKPEDTQDTIIEKIKAKTTDTNKVGPYVFKVGQYGPYMYKAELKTKRFVTVPAGLKFDKMTVREADDLYKKGLAEKEEKAKKGAAFAAMKAAKGLR